MSPAARMQGLRREVERATGAGGSALVVAWTLAEVDELVAALTPPPPLRCRDRFEGAGLGRQLARAGSVAVALAAALRPDMEPGPGVPVEVLVCGRNDARTADETIVGVADRLGGRARVTFHLSLDDALLQRQAASVKPLLARLGLTEGEAISNPRVSRAIARLQSSQGASDR